MPIPVILVDGLQPPPLGTKAHGTKAAGATVALSLQSSLGIDSIEWRMSARAGSAASIANAFPAAPYSTTLGPLAEYESYIITAIANGDPEQIAQVEIAVPSTVYLQRVPRAGETSQWDPVDGIESDWRALVQLVESFVAGGGFTPPGGTNKVLNGAGTAITALPDTLTVDGTALSTIRSGAASGATAIQPTGTSTQIVHGDGSKDTVLDPTIAVSGTALSAIRSGAALGATAVQPTGTSSQVTLGDGSKGNVPRAAIPSATSGNIGGVTPDGNASHVYLGDGSFGTPPTASLTLKSEPITGNVVYSTNADSQYDVYDLTGSPGATYTVTFKDTATRAAGTPLVVRNSTDAPQTIIDPHSVAHTIGAGCEATFLWYQNGGNPYDFVPPTLHGGKGEGWWWTETARVTSATAADYVNVWTLGKLPANSVVDVEVRMSVHRASTAQDAQSVVMALSAVVDNAGAVTAFGNLFTARSISTGTMTGLWDLRVNANVFQARWFQNDAAAGTYRVFCAATITVNTSGA